MLLEQVQALGYSVSGGERGSLDSTRGGGMGVDGVWHRLKEWKAGSCARGGDGYKS
jgi:hypothetical protein